MLTLRERCVLVLALLMLIAGAVLAYPSATARHLAKPTLAVGIDPSPSPDDSPSPSPSPSASPSPPALKPYVLVPYRGPLVAPPPMGWNPFNRYRLNVTEALVKAEAQALVSSGLKSAGYRYVNLDGGWDLMQRAPDGSLQADPSKFPDGIPPLAAYVHSLGLKFGIYTSIGTENCAGTSAGSYGHYQQDAATFAAWGVDYLKLDWCDLPYPNYPHLSHQQVSAQLARQMAQALKATGRPIYLDLNDWKDPAPLRWAPAIASMWRVAPDIHDATWSMIGNFVRDESLSRYSRPGGWNDPDMLEVGNGGMSADAYRAEMSLWAELAAPLIAGNDLTVMTPATRAMLTNQAVLAVDQDRLGVQGYAVSAYEGRWVLTRPLADGSRAVVLFNASGYWSWIGTSVRAIGFSEPAVYSLTNLWSGAVTRTSEDIDAEVPPYGAVMYRVW